MMRKTRSPFRSGVLTLLSGFLFVGLLLSFSSKTTVEQKWSKQERQQRDMYFKHSVILFENADGKQLYVGYQFFNRKGKSNDTTSSGRYQNAKSFAQRNSGETK